MHPAERFLELTRDHELWQEVPLIARSFIVAALRRDPARALALLDALAELWQRAKEDTRA